MPSGANTCLLNVNVFGLACDLLDQRAKQNEVDIGVAENLTGTRLQRRGERTMNALCFVGSVQSPRIFQSTSPVSPEVCVSSMRTVTFARRGSFAVLKSGKYCCTGSSN